MIDRPGRLARLAPVLLVALLAVAWLLPVDGALRLAGGDDAVDARWQEELDGLGANAVVLVGFDPDLGTYAEIRPTVRVVIADLLNRGMRLAFVSVTPEGRALALAELARLDRLGVNPTRIADLGFVSGAEAALVSLTRDLPPATPTGALARRLGDAGIGAASAALVVGGNDFGPRSWVEQIVPRVEGLALLAVAPTVLLPELLPYSATGQLDALIATPRDGATYRLAADLGPLERFAPAREPATLPLLVGLIVALAVLGWSLVARFNGPASARQREP